MTAYERRRGIIEALCLRRHDTRENLAFEFGVDVRTISRDIVFLSLAYPIYTVQGNGGGVYVDEDYRLDGKYLTEEQAGLLRRLSAGLDEKDAKIMRSILNAFEVKRPNREKRK